MEKSSVEIMMEHYNNKEKIKLFFSSRFYRIKNIFYSIKYFMQMIFRKNHTSDIEIWNLYAYLAPYILKKLQAFKDSERSGYPGTFAEYYEHEWSSKEEYEEAVRKGRILGGGKAVWEHYLDEMIFAFEYIVYYENCRQKEKFLEKYKLKDPNEKILKNKRESYVYESKNGGTIISSTPLENEKLIDKSVDYFNVTLDREYAERAQKGFELFGKFFTSLWD